MTTVTAHASSTRRIAAADRRVPPLGGFNHTLLGLELKRLARNKRAMVFTLLMPPVFYLIFGIGADYAGQSAGHGNVSAFIMISMAAYGAMISTTGAGAAVATERALGWSRQLRLTPLRPVAYVATKVVVALVVGALAVGIVYAIGGATNADLDGTWRWVVTALVAWAGAAVFAAFGLFMGYLLPSENVMQILGPGLAVLAFAGGLFVPLQDGSVFATIAQFTPMYGVAQLAHAPLTGEPVHLAWVVNVLAWLAIFVSGAAWRMRRDTDRV